MITAGLVDRAIDDWENSLSRSTVKNTVAVLVLVLDEAMRDGLIQRNPAKDRARRRSAGRSHDSERQVRAAWPCQTSRRSRSWLRKLSRLAGISHTVTS
jgi:hypothetical protein